MTNRPFDINQHYDVIVIGGGIYGAAHAWEAASRGFSVILLEQSDFGSATSANSLKTIHGGIRYLQTLNVKRVLEAKRERDAYMRIAPHLVQPLACVMPSYSWSIKGRFATAIGAGLYNLLSVYDDHVSHATKKLRAALVSKDSIQDTLPHIRMDRISGGIRWYDGQAYDTERLVLDFALSANHRGARIYNYMQAKRLIVADNSVCGVVAEDRLKGREYSIQGEYVVDTTGPWFVQNRRAWGLSGADNPALAKAVNLVFASDNLSCAFGMKLEATGYTSDKSGRLLFAAPWRGKSIVGTWYFPVADPDADLCLSAEEYEICTVDVGQLLKNSSDDASKPSLAHVGLVPVQKDFGMGEYPNLVEETIVSDHSQLDGPDRIISVCGVKYTTARAAAEQTIDVVARRLGNSELSTTNRQPLYGGGMGDYNEFYRVKLDQYGALVDARALDNLFKSYGSSIDQLMAFAEQDSSLYELIPGTSECIKAQVVYALRCELAQRLTDVVVRRIGVGGLGKPSNVTIACCADIMAAEAAWTPAQKAENIQELENYYNAGF